MSLRFAIILNGISKRKNQFYNHLLPTLQQHFTIDIKETMYAGHARELAKTYTGYDAVIAAGGDGTLHHVVNGVLESDAQPLPAIGLIPLGSGNDFARTCGITASADELLATWKKFQPLPTDIGRIQLPSGDGHLRVEHFINVCSVGMGPEVVRRIQQSRFNLGPALKYLSSTITTFFTLQPQPVQIILPSGTWSTDVRVVAIANGTSFGHGLKIAPSASLDDGQFDTFVAGDAPMLRFLIFLQKIKSGVVIQHPAIRYDRCDQAVINSNLPLPMEADGELIGHLPATVNMIPGGIRFLR